MEISLNTLSGEPAAQAAASALACNERSARFGLALTPGQALELAHTQSCALRACGRVAFGAGILDALIDAFCDSPFLGPDNYADTLQELTALFYHSKNETEDRVFDGELLHFMKDAFDGPCHGSLSLLEGRALEALAQALNRGGDVQEALQACIFGQDGGEGAFSRTSSEEAEAEV